MLLNCHTFYSYCFGTLSPQRLLEEVIGKGYVSFALTDINSTSACLDMLRRTQKEGMRMAAGIDFRNGASPCYIGIARDHRGFRELNEHLDLHVHAGQPFTERAPRFLHSYVVYPILWNNKRIRLEEHEYAGVRPGELNRLPFSPWRDHLHKLVVLQPLTFINKRDFNAHRLLRAIDRNMLLSKLPKQEQAPAEEVALTASELERVFGEYPQILENTRRLLADCRLEMEFGTNKNKRFFTGSAADDVALIRRECERGLEYRFGAHPPPAVHERVEKELKMIVELGFCSYFLINHDLVNYARHRNFYYVGRGSGANSMVAYLMRITDVDPLELDLYFERFINPYRTSPPDFDIDFSSLDREEITRYLFDRHGWKNTALLGAYSTFQGRSVVRELGKVFGLPAEEIDKLQRVKDIRQVDEMGRLVLGYCEYIREFPRHLTVHSSGILIAHEPISSYSATMIPPKGFPTVHFSMLEAEDIGLYKFDILGQRGLGKIKDSLDLIRYNRGEDVTIHDLKRIKADPRVAQDLKAGRAIGCFYVESPAMRMLLTKLRAEDYLRLVAASSIIRPGVSQSGMMNEYIRRFHDPDRREKARQAIPELYELLEETYGVMVYQEDVIKVAHYFGELTLAEADVMRRGMSWKYRERVHFDLVKEKFFSNCRRKGHSEETIGDIWRQIESFASYAFAKGHSASYAVESYQALYLKAYWPIEYMTATINNGGGFYRTEIYLHEARQHGAVVELPCVNRSQGLCVVAGSVLYIGLGFLNGLEHETVNAVVIERMRNGPYAGLRDLVRRVAVTLDQLCILVRAGTFRFTGKSKKELLWDAYFLLGHVRRARPARLLFGTGEKEFVMPELSDRPLEDAYDEIELLGYPVSVSPFDLLQEEPDVPLRAVDLRIHVNRQVRIMGYLVHVKYAATHKGERMFFGTWLDRDGQWLDTVHFPDSARQHPFRGPGCYLITGKVIEEFGFISIDVQEIERIATNSSF